ncbi:MAG: polyprenyl synthetase family protein [Leptospira sp.]|nr:polyprenyl synthetase family protein [Leptospira sp.]
MDAFLTSIQKARSLFDEFFLPYINSTFQTYPKSRVSEAALYSLGAGGKRIRPIISIATYYSNDLISTRNVADQNQTNLLILATALECIHTYSLIHDDLPSMDDDDLRRGFPTCHKQFDVPTAILAGDALNSLGFFLVSQIKNDVNVMRDCLTYLHEGAGFSGMITGQMEDLQEEGKSRLTEERLQISPEDRLHSIHRKKTGALIVASFLLGNRLREDYLARESQIKEYANAIGLLFQITDDILDIEGKKETIGKTPGKDEFAGKLTFPSLYGLDQSKIMRDKTKEHAISIAHVLNDRPDSFFVGFPNYLAERQN